MSPALRSYISEIEKARLDLNRLKGEQLNSIKVRDSLRELVEKYFNEVRPTVISDRDQNEEIRKTDDDMQAILVLCHKRGSLKRYKQLLTEAKKRLIVVDSQVVSSSALQANSRQLDSSDSQIISTLQSMIPSAALSYHQAVIDLQSDSRLSWRGQAADLREALRETLDFLAPDDQVEEMPGYKQVKDTKGPTMKQKVRFIMKSRGVAKATSGTAETATEAVEGALGGFVRSVYTRSSVSTHTPTEKNEVLRIRDFVRVVLSELLEVHT